MELFALSNGPENAAYIAQPLHTYKSRPGCDCIFLESD